MRRGPFLAVTVVLVLGVVPLLACGSKSTSCDASTGNCTGEAAEAVGQSCDPSSNALRCYGKQVMVCACTKPFSTDIAGGPLCDSTGYTWEKGELCSVACNVTVAPQTACITSTEPVPECAGVETTCWNGNYTACSQGYPLGGTPCATGTQCTLVPGCEALCLPPSPVQDPACVAAGGGFCADDNVAHYCACGYATGTEDCGSDTCHTDNHYPMCGYLP